FTRYMINISLKLRDLANSSALPVILIIRRFRCTAIVSSLSRGSDQLLLKVPSHLFQVWHRSDEAMLRVVRVVKCRRPYLRSDQAVTIRRIVICPNPIIL